MLPDSFEEALETLQQCAAGTLDQSASVQDTLDYLRWHFDEFSDDQKRRITPQIVAGVVRRRVEESARYLHKYVDDRRDGGGDRAAGYGVGYDAPTSLHNEVILAEALGVDVQDLVPQNIAQLTADFRRFCGDALVRHKLHALGSDGLIIQMHSIANKIPEQADAIHQALRAAEIMED